MKGSAKSSIPSPGLVLKKRRIDSDIAIADIADSLFLSRSQVSSLENDEYDQLPGSTYILGYWRNYANLLDIDISKNIETHRTQLDKLPRTISLDLNHRRDHGYKEKARKKSAVIFFFLSTLFLGGIWYWQSPEPETTNLWVNTRVGNQSAGNTASSRNADIIQDQQPGSAVVFLDKKEANIALPVPNFSDEFKIVSEPNIDQSRVDYDQPWSNIGQNSSLADIVMENTNRQEIDEIDEVNEAVNQENSEIQKDLSGAIDAMVVQPELIQPENIEPTDDWASADGSNSDQLPEVASSGIAISQAITQPQEAKVESEENINSLMATQWSADSPDWIVFKARSQSWLDVRDHRGEKLVYRTVEMGEILKIMGAPPFAVFMGTTDGIDVEYRGQKVEFNPHKSGLFSRFEVGNLN